MVKEKQNNQGKTYQQSGNFGIGYMSGGKIEGQAKVAGKLEENNNSQCQNVNVDVNVNIDPQNDSCLLEKENEERYQQENIEITIEEGNKKASLKTPYTAENLEKCFVFLRECFDSTIKVKDIEKGSIKFTIQGSRKGLKNIADAFASGNLAPILKQRFNLEVEDVQLIDFDLAESYKKDDDQNQSLLALTIAGGVSQAEIDNLKASLIDSSSKDEHKEGYSKQLIATILNNTDSNKQKKTRYVNRLLNPLFKVSLSIDYPVGGFASVAGIALGGAILSIFNSDIEKSNDQKIIEIWTRLEHYVNEDPQSILKNCYPKKHPNCNAQLLSKKLLFKNPPEKLTQISKDLQINYQTLRSHWERKCIPLLQAILKDLGYSDDEK